jgi:3-oxoacyl-[acyl-carrier protein] reductase
MERKKAIVTGAGTGIGQGIALTLGLAGYDVVAHYNQSADGAQQICSRIRDAGGNAWAIQADLRTKDGVDSLFSQALEKLGTLDLFVNNSGVTRKSDFLETTEEFFDDMVSIDLKSAYFCLQAAAKAMVEDGKKGSIVIITSNNGIQQRPNLSVYGTLKAGLIKLTRHAAMELAKYGIRVNAIAPGWTATARTVQIEESTTYNTIPLKRWCQPEEIGQMVLFFASPWAGSLTGNCLIADGGAQLQCDAPELYGL